jgi:hypothetical protein
MRLQHNWMAALLGLVILNGAAFADVTVSQSNDPMAEVGRLSGDQTSNQRLAALGGVEAAAPLAKRQGKGVANAAPKVIRYDAGFLSKLPAASGNAEWECLAKALYFEARGESVKGQFAVAEVILNRVAKPALPPHDLRRGASGQQEGMPVFVYLRPPFRQDPRKGRLAEGGQDCASDD